MSSEQDKAPASGPMANGNGHLAGPKSPWTVGEDGKTVFRRGTPFVVWWAWVVFAVFAIIDGVILHVDYSSAELLAGLLAITGLAYACALRPRVIADNDGISVVNPYREYRLRWGAIRGVFLGDSVEFSCARSAPKKDKTIYCWALYSSRRARARSRLRSQRRGSGVGVFGAGQVFGTSHISDRAPAEARELAKTDSVQLMAGEIGRRHVDATAQGRPDAVLESRWAWFPLAVTLLPAIALLALWLAR